MKDGDYHHFWSCFYLDNESIELSKRMMSVSMCLYAGPGKAKTIALSWEYDDFSDSEIVELTSDFGNTQ